MQDIYKILIGIGVVILGFPLGIFLSRITKDELKGGQIWFKLIILVSAVGAIIALIFSDDIIFFSFLFFMAVTSMSLKKSKK